MVKIFSISLSDWVFDRYLTDIPQYNRSKRIEELIVKGYEVDSGEINTTKQTIMALTKENRLLQDENKKLKQELGRLKSTKQEQKEAEKKAKEEQQFKEFMAKTKARTMRKNNPAAYID
jgi:regulator of replication initiation timing